MAPIDTDAHFFGRVAASYTHEIKNVLATINEAGGLMEDILSLDPEKKIELLDKLPRSLGVIQEQIERGQHLTSQFNTFAHAADHDPAHFELHDTLDMMVDLTQRLARRNRVTLEVQADVQSRLAVTPVAFLKLLFSSILWSVSQSAKDDTVLLGADQPTDAVAIFLQLQQVPEKDPQDHETWPGLEGLARDINGSVLWDPSQKRLVISVPKN